MEWREKHQKSSTLIIREKFCQDIAIGLAKLCHAYGKSLPTRWQSLANSKAKPCQTVGNSLVELLGLPLAQNNVDDDRRTDNGVTAFKGIIPASPGKTQIKLQSSATAPPLKMVTGNREL